MVENHTFDEISIGDTLDVRVTVTAKDTTNHHVTLDCHCTEPHAAQAITLFVYRIVTEIGALAAAMGGLDALVFPAGIGAHSAAIRALICAGCAWLGAELDVAANASGQTRIHTATSRLPLAVISTDEERMIALHTLRNISE